MYRTALLLTVFTASAGCTTLVGDDEFASDGPDPQPTIAILAPVSGTTVSNVVTVLAAASAAAGPPAIVRFDLPDGASITDTAPPFSAAWDSTAVVDGRYTIAATTTDSLGAKATTSATIIVANGGCSGRTFVARGLPRDIPDGGPFGIVSSLSVSGNAGVASLALSLRIAHPFPPDLVIALISPGGTQLPISELSGDPTAGGVVIDDQLISAFNGQRAAGTWTLAVQDLVEGDAGILDAWSLSIAGDCNLASRR